MEEACGRGWLDHYDRFRSQVHLQKSEEVGAGRSKEAGRYQTWRKMATIEDVEVFDFYAERTTIGELKWRLSGSDVRYVQAEVEQFEMPQKEDRAKLLGRCADYKAVVGLGTIRSAVRIEKKNRYDGGLRKGFEAECTVDK